MLLKTIAEISAGQGAPQGDENYCDNGIPFVKAGNLNDLINGLPINEIQKVSEKVAQKHRLKIYKKGSILFAKSGMSCLKGYVYVLPCDAYVVSHLACITPYEDVSDYLKYYFMYNKPNKLIKDASYPSISLTDIGNINIELKSIQYTKNTVSILDKLQSIIKSRKEQLARFDELIKARFVEVFGDPVYNEKQWLTQKLIDMCDSIVDCPHSTPNYTTENTGYMCIRTSIVKKNKILWDEIEYISEQEFYQRIQRKKPEKGDIVYTREGAILGIAAIIDREYNVALGQRSMLLSPNKMICVSEFLSVAMNCDSFLENALKGISGSASPHINVGDIKEFKMILPPIELQNQFAAFVKQIDKSKVAVQKALDEAQLLFDSLMQEYFG